MVKIIIGGGDGSVMRLIDRLYENQIDLNRCIFGILPIGSNNDLSRAIGWGGSLTLTSDFVEFKEIVKTLADAPSVYVDVWEIKLTCDERDGEIIEIKNGDKSSKAENGKIMTTFKKTFISYFSMGMDARIGYGFEKKKTNNNFFNCIKHTWETSKKLCCRKTIPVKGFLESFYTINTESDNRFNRILESNPDTTVRENEMQKAFIFQSVNEQNKIGPTIQQSTTNNRGYEQSAEVNMGSSQVKIKNTVCK